MYTIVSASPKDADLLAALEVRSESYWGYSSEFMEKFKQIYLITEEFIADHPTYMLKDNETIIGFYGILQGDRENSLEYLFIEPAYIGKGYGRILWNHALSECRKLGINEFTIITSPDARGFYFRLGATIFTEVDSQIADGKKTPKLIYRL
ncbi:GNAT family N-acetyltransferase [Proteiniclasticum sp. SCR006]|uniref:GNAT family N-acetyltransferase n=1 Tax=Proteiniclasticum aestuarii TaxID=2817862 RepID=A0A939KFX7_9CLOT|nr:GNAT family N-acetyltransferase [Proteiniclasticum aestuarii]MBO1264927.1 GNAT family N-acetyltransferase [Proteiniclasticum aestuarii]